MTILTTTQVKQIRKLYSKGNVTQTLLANKFGVARTTVSDVVNKVTHRNV
jgi:DNA-binding transcriptional regulator LsrR (DeoR family)